MLSRDRLAVHLEGEDDITKGVNGLFEGEGAAVLVAHLVGVVPRQAHTEQALAGGGGRHLAQGDAIHVQPCTQRDKE